MLLNERQTRTAHLQQIALQMATAARTAPKAKGVDIQEIVVATGDDLVRLSEKMKEIAVEKQRPFFVRDAENVMQSEAVLLIGTRNRNQNLNCGYCGYSTCVEKEHHTGMLCAFNVADVGIALGSAAAMAADLRVDSRVMFSVGLAAQELGFVDDCRAVFGILISASAKSPFFDRELARP